MAQHSLKGNGAPTFVPTRVLQHYLDEVTGTEYMSCGTSNVSDWKPRQVITSYLSSFNSRTGAVTPQAGDYSAAQVGADPSGTAAAALAAHVGASDPHSQYLTTLEGNAAYDTIGAASTVQSNLNSHTGNNSNPHGTTKAQIGLGSCDNTSDLAKPISTLTQAALNAKEATIAAGLTTQYWRGDKSWQTLDKNSVGLSNVPNTDATQRSSHSGTQLAATISDFSTAADARINAQKGVANGVCPLDGANLIPTIYLPGFVDDVLEFANLASFPVTGTNGKIYVALDTNFQYRWAGSTYQVLTSSPGSTDSVPEGSVNLYFTNLRAANAAPVQSVNGGTGAVSITKTSIGLGNVPNVDATVSANITQDATHRFSTDAEKTSWNSKEPGITAGTTAQYFRGDKTFQTLDKTAVGLSSVDNTSDLNKPVSTAQASANTAVQNFAIQRGNHTGTQTASTISDLAATILAQVLTGLSLADATDVTAADTIIQALGKFQAQHNEMRKLKTTANLTNNSSVTTTQITQLGFTCAVGKAYRFKTHILFSSAAIGTGIGLTMTSPDGAVGTLVSTAEMVLSNTDGTTSKYAGAMTALSDLVLSTGVGLTNTFYLAEIEGTFVCTTAGTIAPYFRSETNGQTITVLSGSNNLIWEL